jgi:hypothetical protein
MLGSIAVVLGIERACAQAHKTGSIARTHCDRVHLRVHNMANAFLTAYTWFSVS